MTELTYAEDLKVGSIFSLGDYEVTLDEIKEFSDTWDPQPFHIDDAAAASSYFREPIASGVHSLAVLQRLSVLGMFSGWSVLAGRRIREASFEAPVRAGMVLTGTMVIEAVEHVSDERSLVTVAGTLCHEDTQVLSAVYELYVWRRLSA